MTAPGERLGWRIAELSDLTGIPERSLYDEIRTRRLRAVEFGRRGLWVPRESFEAWQRERAFVERPVRKRVRP